MQLKSLLLAFASTLTLTTAAPAFTNPTFTNVTAGVPFNLEWSGASGAVTLTLKNGLSTDLQTVSTIASGLTGTSYEWTPPASLDTNLYAIEIEDSTNVPNYSTQFTVAGASGTASTTGSSSTSGSTTSTSTGSSTSSGASTTSATTSTVTGVSNSTSSTTGTASTTSSSSAKKTSSSDSTKTGSSTGSSSSSTSAPTSSAADLASPLAFIFLAFAALITLN